MTTYLKEEHEAAARALRCALTLNDAGSWQKLASLFSMRLSAKERGGIAYAALLTLPPDIAEEVFAATTPDKNLGVPLPYSYDATGDAKWWASRASQEEIDAYAVACVLAMSPARRAEFIKAFERRTPAA